MVWTINPGTSVIKEARVSRTLVDMKKATDRWTSSTCRPSTGPGCLKDGSKVGHSAMLDHQNADGTQQSGTAAEAWAGFDELGF